MLRSRTVVEVGVGLRLQTVPGITTSQRVGLFSSRVRVDAAKAGPACHCRFRVGQFHRFGSDRLRGTDVEVDGEGGFVDAWPAKQDRRAYHVAHAVGIRGDQDVLDRPRL
jgi:hypothetical protein